MWKRHNLNTFYKNITNSRDSDELFQLLAHFVSIILKKNYTTRQTKSIFLCNHAVSFYFWCSSCNFWSLRLNILSFDRSLSDLLTNISHIRKKEKKKKFFDISLCQWMFCKPHTNITLTLLGYLHVTFTIYYAFVTNRPSLHRSLDDLWETCHAYEFSFFYLDISLCQYFCVL